MEFSDDYKRKLNILIPYYRNQYLKETGNGKWQQAVFYADDKTKLPICSSMTYCGLEKQGKLVRDEIYEFAAAKLYKLAKENIEWNQIIDVTVNQLHQLMDYRKEEECINILETACISLEVCSNILYYGEILWLFKILKAYLTARNKIISEREFYHLDAITPIYQGSLKELAMYYLYVYANHHEDEKVTYIVGKYDYHSTQMISNQLFAMATDLRNGRMLKFLESGKQLEAVFKETENWLQLYHLYMDIYAFLIEINEENANLYIEKAMKLLSNIQLNDNQKYMAYKNIGTILLYANKYEQSIVWLKKAVHLSDMKLVRCTLCICHAYHMLKLAIPSEYLRINNTTKGDSVDWALYAIYHNFKAGQIEEQKKYLIKKVLPLLGRNDKLYLKIVKEELELLCENGKGYKAIYDYYAYLGKKNEEIQR
ncbi:hypothetical protein MKA58_03445 [[Clostridium] innocuum]|nr:hypothetical protein [[Clostridium] innocuum]